MLTTPKAARPVALAAALALTLSGLGCKGGGGQVTATSAAHHADALVVLSAKDVDEVARGLPEGAKRLSVLYAKGADPSKDLTYVHNLLAKVRRDVVDLSNSKATFFALADEHGVGIRNDLEIDLMAGQNLGQIFPDLAKAEAGGYVETVGTFPGSATKAGPDKDWVAATAVTRDDGSVGGIFVTGWSYRLFARHLFEALKKNIFTEAAANKTPENDIPIFYVALFDSSGIYSAPLTPEVDDEAMKKLDLVAKTASGPFQVLMDITGRSFGVAAARAPRLGADTGIVVLRSEI